MVQNRFHKTEWCRRLIVFFVLALGLMLTGCGSSTETGSDTKTNGSAAQSGGGKTKSSDSSQKGNKELPVVRLQGLSGGLGPIVLKVMEQQGFDKANGFQGEYQYIDPDASVQNFLLGKSDVSFDMDVMGTALARSQGHDPVVFYPSLKMNNSVIVREDSPYKSPKDLIGKKVGHFGTDSATTTSLSIMLKELYGIDILKDYQLVEMGPATLVELLKKGEVEAIFNFDPNNARAIAQIPGRVIFSANDAWTEHTGGTLWLTNLVASEKWLKDNKELAYAVRDAYDDSYKWITENKYEFFKQEPFKSMIKQDDPKVMEKLIERANAFPFYTNSWTEDDLKRAENFVDLMAKQAALIKENPGGTVTTLEKFLGPR